MELSVSFPRPRIGKVEHASETEITQGWLRSLLDMPVQHAVVWADSDVPRLVRVDDVPDALNHPQIDQILASVLGIWRERLCSPEATEEWRIAGMEEVIQTHKSRQVVPATPIAKPEQMILTPRQATYGEGRTMAQSKRKPSEPKCPIVTMTEVVAQPFSPESVMLTSHGGKDAEIAAVPAPPAATTKRKKTPVLSPNELTKPLPNAYEVAEDGSLG